ncbi:MAG: SMC-Scp complex subunit ScpB [Siculibacillus sp.]|nr:SMC-Scp complex subunit ScpB [Siculibacillus sp.]
MSDLFEDDEDGDVAALERETAARRLVEALIFASAEPVGEEALAAELPAGVDLPAVLARLEADYAGRGVELVRVAGKWQFRTAADLAARLVHDTVEPKKLGRAALETLAIVAYHQPVTRAEIEQIRGVQMSKGTLDVLLEAGWIRMRGRRRTPGRPVTWGTTEDFLVHFGLDSIQDLPGLEELKGAGLLEGQIPAGFAVPLPSDDTALTPDEDPLDAADLLGADAIEPVDADEDDREREAD